jgi:hypothetical protein
VTPTPPTPAAFVRALEAELWLRGAAFELRDLLEYAEAVWPLARDDADPGRWADRFLESQAPACGQERVYHPTE